MIHNKKGFTLVEILIVVAIIGILASVILVGLGGSRTAAQDAKKMAELRQVQSALELYRNSGPTGFYPDYDTVGLGDYVSMSSDITAGGIGVNVMPSGEYAYASDGFNYVLGVHINNNAPAGYVDPRGPDFTPTDLLFTCDGAGSTDLTLLNYCLTL